jgi:hypothetical protein
MHGAARPVFFVCCCGMVHNEAQGQLYLLDTESWYSILCSLRQDLQNPWHQVAIPVKNFILVPSIFETNVIGFS